MAAPTATKPPGVGDDDEAWLYGDADNTENKEPAAPGTGPTGKLPPPKEKEEGEMSTSEPASQSQDKDDDDDDSDDDDDVQVTIGDIKAFPVTSAGGNLFKPGGTYQKQPVVAPAGQKGAGGASIPGVKGVDVEGEGQVNGIPLYEFSLDTLRDEDKPWRKPGADITDYFNYGFNETTWRNYCQKQTRLRSDNGLSIPKAFGSTTTTVKIESDPVGHHPMKIYNKPLQPIQTTPGTIAVLGSTTASRRPAEEHHDDGIQQIGTLGGDVNKPPPGMPPMGMHAPDFSMPPPGMPPMPPGFSPAVPPPGMPVPPPNMFSHPPPVPPFFPPHVPPPAENRSFSERPSYSAYDPANPTSSYTDSYSRDRDREHDSYRDRERDRYDYKRDRSPGSGYSSGGSDEYNRYGSSRSTREYASTREFESRDYYRARETDTGRSRSDRDRERSRSRSRDRDRRHRDRDRDDKKSKRKIKDEPDDSDYYKSSSSSSKHKKSKRSKRDKDDDSADKTDDP